MRIIIVHWQDAGSAYTQEEAESIYRYSVGYEVESVPGKGVTIAMESDALSQVHHIPWGMVKSIREVETEQKHPQ